MQQENTKLYCLEVVRDKASHTSSVLFPMLEHLAIRHGIDSVYQCCDSISGFEQSLNDLFYEDRNFRNYDAIYLVVPGHKSELVIDGYRYSFEEIAELFEAKLKGKLVHFANAAQLGIDLETAQYFIDVTGAKALSGYTQSDRLDSLFLDSKLFEYYYEETDDPEDLARLLLENQNALCHNLGFRLFY